MFFSLRTRLLTAALVGLVLVVAAVATAAGGSDRSETTAQARAGRDEGAPASVERSPDKAATTSTSTVTSTTSSTTTTTSASTSTTAPPAPTTPTTDRPTTNAAPTGPAPTSPAPTNPAPTNPAPTNPPATAAPQPTGGSTPQASECESVMLGWMNEARAANGRHGLAGNSTLAGMARTWSTKMATTGVLAHNPNSLPTLLTMGNAGAENVGYSTASARSVFDSFMGSATHRDNILATNVGQVGVGCVFSGGKVWVTQLFLG